MSGMLETEVVGDRRGGILYIISNVDREGKFALLGGLHIKSGNLVVGLLKYPMVLKVTPDELGCVVHHEV